jgi:hypothetical protein
MTNNPAITAGGGIGALGTALTLAVEIDWR